KREKLSVIELKERHAAAVEQVNSLRDLLKQRRSVLFDTDGARFAAAQGKTAVSFGQTDLVCCRTLQGPTGKVLPFNIRERDFHFGSNVGLRKQDPVLLDLKVSILISKASSKTFVSGSCDSTARLWDTHVASRAVRTFYGHEGDVNIVQFFPAGNRFATGSDDGTCRLFDIRTGHQLQKYYQPHSESEVSHVKTTAFSVSGRLLFAGYSNGDCYVWDTLLAKLKYEQPYLPLRWHEQRLLYNPFQGA
ncbi:Guanine nucleotide-binding protein subunit beta-2, partial [Bienertia sinuspersici]